MPVFDPEQPATPTSVGDIAIIATQSADGVLTLDYGVQIVYSDGTIKERRGDLSPIIATLATDEQRAALGAFVAILRATAQSEMIVE